MGAGAWAGSQLQRTLHPSGLPLGSACKAQPPSPAGWPRKLGATMHSTGQRNLPGSGGTQYRRSASRCPRICWPHGRLGACTPACLPHARGVPEPRWRHKLQRPGGRAAGQCDIVGEQFSRVDKLQCLNALYQFCWDRHNAACHLEWDGFWLGVGASDGGTAP